MTPWTDEMVAIAIDGFNKGVPYPEIGRTIGMTRSAVSGKLIRLGYKRTHEVAMDMQRAVDSAAKLTKIARRPKVRVNPPKPTRDADDIYAPIEEVPKTAWLALEGSTPQTEIPSTGLCKWPIGGDDDRRWCCNTAKLNEKGKPLPYCPAHHDMSVSKTATPYSLKRQERGAIWAAMRAA